MPTVRMMSLQNLCKQAVLKFGIATDKLPQAIIEDLTTLEKRIAIDFTGVFVDKSNPDEHAYLAIDWSGGMWSFTPDNHPTMEIKAGGKSNLGVIWGDWLYLPGEVSFEHYEFDFEELKVIFHGRFKFLTEDMKLKCTLSSSGFNVKLKTEVNVWNGVDSSEKIWFRIVGPDGIPGVTSVSEYFKS
eukprot:GFUD01020274.1.p1 GENE.GFUD01020274.1~~GFUD01020274.1.p1  ORF type:complete len:186 (+),score=44.51 GFUD01020274.1:83-640(+)